MIWKKEDVDHYFIKHVECALLGLHDIDKIFLDIKRAYGLYKDRLNAIYELEEEKATSQAQGCEGCIELGRSIGVNPHCTPCCDCVRDKRSSDNYAPKPPADSKGG